MTTETIPARPVDSRPWWREPEILMLLVLVAGAYLIRVGDLSMRGEEPRRVRVSFELIDRNDWVVPRQQGSPFLSRPPFQNWVIAASSVLLQSRAPWAVRMHSVLAMMGTVVLIYGYSRIRLSRLGAFAAAAAFATLGEMFTMGCQAETEMLYILIVSASVLLWHWGYLRGWSPWVMWIVSYVLVGIGVLTKGGLQSQVYFMGPVVLFLVWNRQWRLLFHPAHFVGILVGTGIVAAWFIPCCQRVGMETTMWMFGADTAMRFRNWNAMEVIRHLLQFPVEVLGSTAPWSLFLLAYLSTRFRQSLGASGAIVGFLALVVAIAFPTVWIPPYGQTRYIAPIYPFLAILIGAVVDHCAQASCVSSLKRGWTFAAVMSAGLMMIAAVATLCSPFAAMSAKFSLWAESPTVAALCAAAFVGLAVVMYRSRFAADAGHVRAATIAMACFMVITFTVLITNVKLRRSEDQADAIAALKSGPLAGRKLVSFGYVHWLFAYYYDDMIDAMPFPQAANEAPEGDVDFCYQVDGDRPKLPFDVDVIATISMERSRSNRPDQLLEIVRRRRSVDATPVSRDR